MTKPKLILTDLDGTLLRDDKSLSLRNRAALERAADQGAQVVVATGRFFVGIPPEVRELPFLRYFILMNGAKIYDRQTDKTLARREIDLETAEQLFDLLETLDVAMDCYQNDRALMARHYYERLDYFIPDPVSRHLVESKRIPQDDFRGVVRAGGSSVQKIQCFFPRTESRPQVMELVARKFPQLVQSTSLPGNLEFNQAGATKGAALLSLCQWLGIDQRESAAFGDGTNDLAMIQTAGVGVAMSNAAPEVLAAADLVAPTNETDGVAQVLERWFETTS
jgi:hypothetical protein